MSIHTFQFSFLKIIAILFVGITLNGVAIGQDEDCLPKKPSASTAISKAYVHDFTNSFSERERAQLNNHFRTFRTKTSNEIVLISTNDLCGMDVWDYGVKIGNNWGVGQEDFDNGLVIVYKAKTATSRGEIAVAVGRGLEGAVPDGAAKIIIEREMIPQFKRGQIVQGLHDGLAVFEGLLQEEYSFNNYKTKSKTKDYSMYGPLVVILFFLLFYLIQVVIYTRTNKISFWKALIIVSTTRGTHSGRWGGFVGGSGGFGGYHRGGGGFGGGGSGGGGFGGFGGGGFGGGGASGSW